MECLAEVIANATNTKIEDVYHYFGMNRYRGYKRFSLKMTARYLASHNIFFGAFNVRENYIKFSNQVVRFQPLKDPCIIFTKIKENRKDYDSEVYCHAVYWDTKNIIDGNYKRKRKLTDYKIIGIIPLIKGEDLGFY